MYLPYCVPIHWGGEGELVMPALDSHSFTGYFGNPVSYTVLISFVFLIFFFYIWLIPAELGQFLWGSGQLPFSGMASLPSSTASVSLCSVSSKSKMILISTDMYSLQLKSDLY